MNTGSVSAASLQNLHDITTPTAVAWWPLAPGWYVLGALLVLATMAWGMQRWRRYQRNRYRREALRRLAEIQRLTDTTKAAAALAALLKQTALGAWPRTRVAALSGADWRDFMDQTGQAGPLADSLNAIVYRSHAVDKTDLATLYSSAEHWIRHHRREAA